jgi:hypothetical protein
MTEKVYFVQVEVTTDSIQIVYIIENSPLEFFLSATPSECPRFRTS